MEQPEIDFGVLANFDKAREQLFIRVSSVEKNADYLAKVPHTIVEDMAITYHLKMNVDESGVASSAVTNDTLQMYGVSVEELHQAALENSEKMFPVKIFDMHEHMRQSFIDDMKKDGMPDEMIEMFLEDFPQPGENGMTVVTNDVGVNGAAAIFYPGVMEKLAEMTKGDFFILPSSLHEMIILPDRGDFSPEQLSEMVKEINETLKQEPAASDAKINALMEKYFKALQAESAINAETYAEVSKVIPLAKAAKAFTLEEKFRRMLIRQLRR